MTAPPTSHSLTPSLPTLTPNRPLVALHSDILLQELPFRFFIYVGYFYDMAQIIASLRNKSKRNESQIVTKLVGKLTSDGSRMFAVSLARRRKTERWWSSRPEGKPYGVTSPARESYRSPFWCWCMGRRSLHKPSRVHVSHELGETGKGRGRMACRCDAP